MSQESRLGTPAHVRERVEVIADQLSAFEGLADPVFHEITETDFGGKVSGNRIGIEPGEQGDLHIRLGYQRSGIPFSRRQLHTAERAGGGESQVISVALTGAEVDQHIIADEL